MSKLSIACLASIGFAVAACSGSGTDTSAPSNGLAVDMSSAFSTTPAGFDQMTTSFDGSPSATGFMPTFDRGNRGRGGFGPLGRGPGFGLGFMGGGLGTPFFGDGIAFFLLHQTDACTFDTTTGIESCSVTRKNGLTVTRTLKFTALDGTAQSKFDATTDAFTTTASVTGSRSRQDSMSTSTVNESNSVTVSGLAAPSMSRTVNAVSSATEATTGTSPFGAFTSQRMAGDTVTGLVVAAPGSGKPFYPTAGTVIRSMSVSITLNGVTPMSSTRREEITYDGSATAKVVIDHDGTTQNCTLPLPFGHLTCQ